ncbi:MAG: amino acid adenylation domain-containing protein [Actinomycetota bacterium]|nr:amino acid adenylation domain-containing protein [Actinomycetota bacterium]
MLSDTTRELLAARLRRAKPTTTAPITARPVDLTEIPLSFAQEQLWFLDRFAPGKPTYNVPGRLRLRGPLEVDALQRALTAVRARHEALRTRLVEGPHGRPVQLIDPPAELPTPLVRLAETELAAFCTTEAARPFDLARGPLLRIHLLKLAEDEHVLLLVMHHSVFDAWSYGVLLRELSVLYEADVAGRPADLPALDVQFADYAIWERDRLDGAGQELVDFWRQNLGGCESLQLPTDRPRPALESFRGGIERLNLGIEAIEGVRVLGRQQGSTPFAVLLAALQAVLHRYTGQHDIVVGAPSANRGKSKLQPLIGFLVNTLPIRTDLSGDPAFTELLRRVRENTVAAYAHQELPFAKMVEALGVARDPGRAPVFQVAMTFAEAPEPVRVADLRLRWEAVDLLAAKFDLAFFAEIRTDGLWLEVAYASDLFEVTTVRRLLGHYAELLTGALAEPELRVSELPLLDEAELFAELVAFNDTAAELTTGCLHEIFQARVAEAPEAVAAVCGGEEISYAELNAQANQLGRWLSAQGAGPEVLVGIAMAPSIRRLAVLLGVLKAGAGYLPLDPALPADRLSFMMGDAAVPMVLTDSRSDQLTELGTVVLAMDECWAAIGDCAPDDLGVELADSAVAYVIYTSGSTGRPKGVLVEHRQVANFAAGLIELLPISAADRVLQFASLNFDVSVLDMFATLLRGACAVLADRETLLSPPRLGQLMRSEHVSMTCLPPAVIELLTDQEFPDLHVLISAGEQLPTTLAQAWLRPGLRLINGYGPTETTVLSLAAEVTGDSWPAPIGLPLPNYQAYVLDHALNPVPIGVLGELHTGGASVARGYLNRPELTAERFIEDPFSDEPGARLYKTGDLVRRLPDGRISFVGRADGQVKLRGLRLELGEIEAALSRQPAVAQAVVLVRADRAGEQQLIGYLRAEPGVQPPDPAELKQQLSQWLPGYMVPAQLCWIEEFPLNASGKLDRTALLSVAAEDQPTGEYLPPATPTESALAGIYAELLNRDRVAADDDFFDIGGNSLQAMQLVSRIRTRLAVDLPVTAIFLAPSPRRLAVRIEAVQGGGTQSEAAGPIVPMSDGLGTEPLFLVHAVGGTVYAYAALAAELADRYRVLGIQAPGLAGEPAQAASLAELAAGYLTELRRVQPAGPYRLGGWSMGGLLAYEISQQLEADGQLVELLVLLDAPFAIEPDTADEQALAGQFVADALRTLGRPEPIHADTGTVADGDADAGTVAEQLDRLASLLDPSGDLAATRAEVGRRYGVFSAHRRLLAGYRPAGTVRARALLIGAENSPNAGAQSCWPAVLDQHTRCRYPADHYTLLQPPLSREIAALIVD